MKTLKGYVVKKLVRLISIFFFIFVLPTTSYATTVINVRYDFGFSANSNTDFGLGIFDISVDPDNLPFDDWYNFNEFTLLRSDIYSNFYGYMNHNSPLVIDSAAEFNITNNNPVFPIAHRSDSVELPGRLFSMHDYPYGYYGLNNSTLYFDFDVYDDGTWTAIQTNPELVDPEDVVDWDGVWNASVWFDDPVESPAVPVPSSIWLFGSGLLGVVGFARRKR